MGFKHDILHRDGTPKIYNSPATIGQYLYFTTKSDDIHNNIVGGGSPLILENIEGKDYVEVEAQFLENIQLKNAYIFWENAIWGDVLTAEVILPANTPFNQPTDTGNANLIDGKYVCITTSSIKDETWKGQYLLFPVDIPIVRFVNEFRMIGTNNIGTILESPGAAFITKELKIKISYSNKAQVNRAIKIFVMAEIYRENTI